MAVTTSWSAAWTARKMSATWAGVAVAAEPLAAIAVMSHALVEHVPVALAGHRMFLLVVPLVDGDPRHPG